VTKVIPRNPNPSFDETFEWDYSLSSSKLFISVWDRDEFSSDDLVGCVTLDMG